MKVPAYKRRASLQLEQLESRLTPAKILSPTVIMYQDTDGDLVKVTTTKPLWDRVPQATIENIFTFDTGTVDGDLSTGQTLDRLDLSQLDSIYQRNLSLAVAVSTTLGDGASNVGEIIASEGLGKVRVAGTLQTITAGDGTVGMESLTVHYLGGETAPNVVSNISGTLKALKVIYDIDNATLNVDGHLGTAYVGRDIIGGGADDSGAVLIVGNIGNFIIRGNVTGSTGIGSGRIDAGGYIAGVTLLGRLEGGDSDNTGTITTGTRIGDVTIGGIFGGIGAGSGRVNIGSYTGKFNITGDIEGGDGDDSGQIVAQGKIAQVTGRSVIGGAGARSGGIFTQGVLTNMGTVLLYGSLKGGTGTQSGAIISSGKVGVKITRDMIGGSIPAGFAADVNQSGYIQGRQITNINIGGVLKAGLNEDVGVSILTNSGAIRSEFEIGSIRVGGNMIGSATNRVLITARGQLTPSATKDLAIFDMIVGGKMDRADVLAGYDINDDTTTGLPIPLNPDAQVGNCTVVTNFIASNLIAGVDYGPDGFFGTADDSLIGGTDNVAIVSKLGLVRIKGGVIGTNSDPSDTYGIGAQYILGLEIAIQKVPQIVAFPGPNNNTFALGNEVDMTPLTTNDMFAYEV